MKNFSQHLFICTNNRANGEQSCGGSGALELLQYAKERGAKLGFKEKNIRINSSGCLGNCKFGPVMVIYPQGKWYSCNSKEEIDQLLLAIR